MKTLCRILSQTSREKPADIRGGWRWQGGPVGLALQNADERVGDCLALERKASGQHLEEHAAKRPDVRALVDCLTARLLRAHVRRRSEDAPFRRFLARTRRPLALVSLLPGRDRLG